MTETLQELGEHIARALPGAVRGTSVVHGELSVTVDRNRVVEAMTFLRDDARCSYKILIDVCGVDYPSRPERFEVVYHLLSVEHNRRVRVRLSVDEHTPVPSVTGVYNAANWFERETWDLYGIPFTDHPDLRRILTDYGFEGHPMRKDFPLTGYVEVRYDDQKKRVVYEPVRLPQEFRRFDFLSPWEGMTREILPGDEKANVAPPGPSPQAPKAGSAD